MDQVPHPTRDSPGQPHGKRLDSWKAIAEYLNRDVSTVRRWEKQEGLPVHRHLHRKLGSVYAFALEIDDWWKNGHRGEANAGGVEAEATAGAAAMASRPGAVQDPRVEGAVRPLFLRAGLVAVAGLAIASLWYGLIRARPNPAPLDAPDFIAVMPIADVTGGSPDEVLVDGLTEGIINGLSGVPGLKVISRNSSFRYKGKEIVPGRIGRELGGVHALLVGQVHRQDDRVILRAELIDARDDSHLWGNTYERRQAGPGASLQQAVVRDVVRRLTGREPDTSHSLYSRNAEVYDLYLLGRYHWYKRTADGFTRAIAAFSRAVEEDPTFAPAYAGLADTYTLMGYFSFLIPFEEARAKARAAALQALALDDSLAEAHTSMASVLEFEQWDWAGAEREYQRAIQLAPSYAPAYHWYANNLSIRGRHEEAIAQGRRAVELDPLSPILHVALAHAYLVAGRNDEALGQLSKALDLEPQLANAHFFQAMAYIRLGRHDEALAEMLTADRLLDSWVWKACLADLYIRIQRPSDARHIVDAFERRRTHASHVTTAAIHAAVGGRKKALDSLRRACDARDPDIGFVKSLTAFDGLRGDPEFERILRQTGLN